MKTQDTKKEVFNLEFTELEERLEMAQVAPSDTIRCNIV